jgi:hypothetical protein
MSTQTHVSPKRPNETDLGYSRRIAEAKHTLIAAAPEMLEALKISRGNVASLNAAHPAIWGEWLKMIDAAIAKAEAEQ